MILRLKPEEDNGIIDFTSQYWGHALHGSTLYQKKATSIIERIKDKKLKRRRYTVMVHTSRNPEEGKMIRYKAERGIVEAEIVSVEPCHNPDDMFTLEILVTE